MSGRLIEPAAYETGAETARAELDLALFGFGGHLCPNKRVDRERARRCGDIAQGMIAEAVVYLAVTHGQDAVAEIFREIMNCLESDALSRHS